MSFPTIKFRILLATIVVYGVNSNSEGQVLEKLSSCACYLPNETMVDISSLADSGGKAKYRDVESTTYSNWLYSYNPCYPFTQSVTGDVKGDLCNNVAVCQHSQKVPGISPYYFNIGIQDTVKYELKSSDDIRTLLASVTSYDDDVIKKLTADSDGHVTFTYSDKMENPERISVVIMMCTDIKGFIAVGEIMPPTTPAQFVFMLSGPEACPVPYSGSGGLSTGSLICILLFVSLLVYLIVGILVMKFVYHASGSDLIPNKSLWVGAAESVRDGCRFAAAKVTGKQEQHYQGISQTHGHSTP